MVRRGLQLVLSARRALHTGRKPRKVWDRAAVRAAEDARREAERRRHVAQWASSWMMPWERAAMDHATRPLKLWERVYWRLFIAFGGIGFFYETYVLENRRVLLSSAKRDVPEGCALPRVASGALHGGNHAFRSHRLLSDAEIDGAPAHNSE